MALDLTTGKKELITRLNKDAFGKQIDVHIGFVIWKTEDRLLFQISSEPNDGLDYTRMSRGSVLKLGERLYARGSQRQEPRAHVRRAIRTTSWSAPSTPAISPRCCGRIPSTY